MTKKFLNCQSFSNLKKHDRQPQLSERYWSVEHREFDHPFLPQGQGIRPKNLPGWPGFGCSKNFPDVARGMYPVRID